MRIRRDRYIRNVRKRNVNSLIKNIKLKQIFDLLIIRSFFDKIL